MTETVCEYLRGKAELLDGRIEFARGCRGPNGEMWHWVVRLIDDYDGYTNYLHDGDHNMYPKTSVQERTASFESPEIALQALIQYRTKCSHGG